MHADPFHKVLTHFLCLRLAQEQKGVYTDEAGRPHVAQEVFSEGVKVLVPVFHLLL